MRIFDSNFDYYDRTCKSFQDDLTWERTASSMKIDSNFPFYIPHVWNSWNEPYIFNENNYKIRIEQFSILMAGKIYHGIEVEIDGTKTHIFNEEDLYIHVEIIGKKKSYRKWLHGYIPTYDLWNQSNEMKDTQLNYCIAHGIVTGIIRLDRRYPIFNINVSNLKEYSFQRIVPPILAYQEISMFIGGVLPRKENQTVVLEDKYKIQKSGFDLKTSFRHRKVK